MKNTIDQIAKLLRLGNVDATRGAGDGCRWIMAGSLLITELYFSGPLSPIISFECDQEYIYLTMKSDSIEGMDVAVDEEKRPFLYVGTKSGYYFEFSLTKEEVHERAE